MRALVITNSITNRDEKSVERYLNDISKYDVLTPEQEAELFTRYQSGDQAALEKILAHNLRFVVSVAKQYQHMGLSFNDLINEGNIGLITAAKRFDISRGFKFISYAVWWIRQRILQALNEKSRKIRLPLSRQSSLTKIRRCQEKLLQELNRPPSYEEIAREMEFDAAYVEEILRSAQYSKSLDAPLQEGEDADFKYFMEDETIEKPDEQLTGSDSLKIEVRALLHKLSHREQTILTMSFGLDRKYSMGLEEIGEYLGISKERVRQIRLRAMRKLRLYVQRNDMTFSI